MAISALYGKDLKGIRPFLFSGGFPGPVRCGSGLCIVGKFAIMSLYLEEVER